MSTRFTIFFFSLLFFNAASAQTSVTDESGNKYSGTFLKTDFTGTGTCQYVNGDTYTGSWKSGDYEGTGTYQWKNGDKYTGQWKSGYQHSGVMILANKEKYDGAWKEGAMDGKGTYYYDNGKVMYKGDWKDNQYNGEGVWFSEDRMEWYTGTFNKGERTTGTLKVRISSVDTLVYTGSFKNGELAHGTIIYPGGSYYKGPVKNRVPDVNGNFHYVVNGKVIANYVGSWTNGVKDGSGVYAYYTDFAREKIAKIYSGIWRENELVLGESYQAGTLSYSGKFGDVTTLEKALAGDVIAMFDMGNFCLSQNQGKDGIGWLEKSAAQSYGQAIYMLGNIYMQGKFVPKDEQKSQAYYSQSMPLLQQAASRNDTTAILLLGFHQLQNGEKEGIALLEKASSMGNADAMIALGAVYEAGKMVTKDAGKAMKLYRGAAEKENTMGMYMLGRHLYEGDLGTQNTSEGLQWLEKAGSLGYTEVYMYLGETFKNSKKGAGYFEKGAELDNVECMIKAADDSYVKNGWISNFYALTLIQRAARNGHKGALYFLGAAYHMGNNTYGIYKDCETAVEYYSKLAAMREAQAYKYIFYIYSATFNNKNNKAYCEKVKDYNKAMAWLQKGADAGITEVMRFLALQYGTANPAKSFPLYLKAAELGDIDYLLIDYFKEGLGTPRSKQQAAFWQRKYDEQERNRKSNSNN